MCGRDLDVCCWNRLALELGTHPLSVADDHATGSSRCLQNPPPDDCMTMIAGYPELDGKLEANVWKRGRAARGRFTSESRSQSPDREAAAEVAAEALP